MNRIKKISDSRTIRIFLIPKKFLTLTFIANVRNKIINISEGLI